ncbi:hypothetical protein EDD11_002247 [Mortierella claussenii]|nr:hypothetical protein EDD11_002247 [Mortierella claussenii]
MVHTSNEGQPEMARLERVSPVAEEKPPVVQEVHSVDDVEYMTTTLIPPFPDLEERACEIFQWDIKDWRALDKRVTGPEFEIGGYKWQVDTWNDPR